MHTLKPGDKAPQFALPNQNGDLISLADCLNSGPVLVYFYPKALTPGCTDQACGLRDCKAALDAKGVTVLGISPDGVAKLKKFEQKHGLNFHLLSDEDHSVADAFGVWGEKKFMGRVYNGIHRLSFIINSDGTIGVALNKFKTKTHHETVLENL